jgi:hypothetical protein
VRVTPSIGHPHGDKLRRGDNPVGIRAMPTLSHPLKKGALVILMNYGDHAPPHIQAKYQGDVRSYRNEIRTRV